MIMKALTQEYAIEMYGNECEKRGEKRGIKRGEKIGRIEAAVKVFQKFGATLDEAINMLAQDLGLTPEKAAQYVNKLWKR